MINTARAIPYAKMKKLAEGIDDYDILVMQNTHDNMWIISITDADIQPLFKDSEKVLTVQFEDVDPDCHVDIFKDMENVSDELDQMVTEVCFAGAFTPDLAKKVADFIVRAHANPDANDCLLVNCMAGVSRSGAVVTFAQQICRIDYDKFTRMNRQIVPNRYVLKHLSEYYSTLNP
jgi:predicted protein tyrosine phosphatase